MFSAGVAPAELAELALQNNNIQAGEDVRGSAPTSEEGTGDRDEMDLSHASLPLESEADDEDEDEETSADQLPDRPPMLDVKIRVEAVDSESKSLELLNLGEQALLAGSKTSLEDFKQTIEAELNFVNDQPDVNIEVEQVKGFDGRILFDSMILQAIAHDIHEYKEKHNIGHSDGLELTVVVKSSAVCFQDSIKDKPTTIDLNHHVHPQQQQVARRLLERARHLLTEGNSLITEDKPAAQLRSQQKTNPLLTINM